MVLVVLVALPDLDDLRMFGGGRNEIENPEALQTFVPSTLVPILEQQRVGSVEKIDAVDGLRYHVEIIRYGAVSIAASVGIGTPIASDRAITMIATIAAPTTKR
jgi:hypothetical protein